MSAKIAADRRSGILAYTQSIPYSISKSNLPDEMSLVIEEFQGGKGCWVAAHCQVIRRGDVRYYGIRKDDQMQKSIQDTQRSYHFLRSNLLYNMGMNPEAQIIQVIGDSAPFSPTGTFRALHFLKHHLSSHDAILYGYTGYMVTDGTRCVNAAVTDVVLEKNLQKNTIGNLVGFHTKEALNRWGCTGPALQNYIVVYGDNETCREQGTVFGDDIVTSDFLTDHFLVLEGGAQTFAQICNALFLGRKITILTDGLRSPSRSHAPDGTPYFSAAKFLDDCTKFFKLNGDKPLQNWYLSYFGPGKCYLSDPKKPDFDTKQKLMDQAWHAFTTHSLYIRWIVEPIAPQIIPLRSRL